MTLTELRTEMKVGVASREELDKRQRELMEGYGYVNVKGRWVKHPLKDDIKAVPVGFWMEDDGGRAKAGYLGKAGDCVTRAFAIAQYGPGPSGDEYKDVYIATWVADPDVGLGGALQPPQEAVQRWQSVHAS